MDIRPWTATRPASIDLASAAAFSLGPLLVNPSTRRIDGSGRSKIIEPRVMRVLVALGETPGRVLSRDALIELCWDGQLVTDNAITRVISLLRHALDDLSGGAVRVETITKVGFQLVVDGQAAGAPPLCDPLLGVAGPGPAPIAQANMPAGLRQWSRRATALGLVAAGGAAVIGTAAWFQTRQHAPDPRAVALYQRGQAIQKAGVFEAIGQALEYYKQAVAIDPHYADAWGALALSYRYPVISPETRLGDPQEVRTAAQRALALDPDNADARLALITLYPCNRRWQEREVQLRAFLRDHPDSVLGHFRLGEILVDVGRIEDAVTLNEHAISLDPTRQICWAALALTYFYAGRDREADVTIEGARSRWPQDRMLYVLGYYFILYSKRYSEALAYVSDSSRRPRVFRRDQAEFWMHQADALATGRGLAEFKNMARAPVSAAMGSLLFAAQSEVLFGRVDELFALLEVYFFGGSVDEKRFDPPGPLDLRPSYPLFAPLVLSLRNDPRFASLLARTGLEDYWRKSGTQPDFRRG
jgi:DNA-binding winged helix-turn-helix (wHTH) protein/tetratricopeptide (TPR) repeat protein